MATIAIGCAKTEIQENVGINGGGEPAPVQIAKDDDVASCPFIPGQAVVKFSDAEVERIEAGKMLPENVRKELGISSMERLFPYAGEFEERTRREGLHKYYVVEFDPKFDLDAAERIMKSVEGIELFEKQHKVTDLTFNDTYYKNLWAFTDSKYSIRVESAWNYTTGDPKVKVCVVDGGITPDHPDLEWNLDLEHSYNYVSRKSAITGEEHGTHVAGTIAGVSNNGIGVAGIAGGDYAAGKKGITLISAQVFEGNRSASSFATALKDGADKGAIISQNSWGYSFDYNDDGQLTGQELTDALAATIDGSLRNAVDYFIKYAGCDNKGEQLPDSPMKGGVVCFAAGNDGIANGAPANYTPIVSVGATDKSGAVTFFSNYGDWVDICAPGSNIYSCVTGGKYGYLSGTSMACPHVSGVCALIASYFGRQGFTNADLEELLIEGANPKLISQGSHHVGPYLDALGSIEYGIMKYRRENNQAPTVWKDTEGNLTFRQWETVEMPIHFHDPDGDVVNVEAEIEGRAQLKRQNDTTYIFSMLCELVSDFTPQHVKITATDMFDASSTLEFTYTVMKNNAPTASGKIQDKILYGTGNPVTVDLASVFNDVDEEPLIYNAKLNPAAGGSVKVDGSKITVTPSAYGSLQVITSASDHMREKAENPFTILVRQEGHEIDYYPNPVKDVLHVRTGAEKKAAQITISSSTGKTVFDESIECSAFEPADIDMKDFAPGEYKLTVVNGGKTFTNVIAKI